MLLCVGVFVWCVCMCVCVCVCVAMLYQSFDTQFMESMGNLKANDTYEKRLLELEVEKPQANASK